MLISGAAQYNLKNTLNHSPSHGGNRQEPLTRATVAWRRHLLLWLISLPLALAAGWLLWDSINGQWLLGTMIGGSWFITIIISTLFMHYLIGQFN